MFTRPLAKHITFWEGVVRETIGAMTAPGDLT
jgi:hypothetical protein